MDFFIAAGLMLSPRALAAAGNAAGLLGPWFFVLLAVLLCWAVCCVTSHRALLAAQPRLPGPAAETSALAPLIGPLASLVLPLCRFALLAAHATSALALAGFAGNEVFLRSFPNMGFTFMLLTGICVAHLFPRGIPRALQAVAAGAAIPAIGTVAVAGLLAAGASELGPPPATVMDIPQLLIALAPAAVLFMGVELGGVTGSGSRRSRVPWALITLLVMACCLAAFALAAQHHVGLEKLARSSVPHIVAGRRILGDFGRYLIGGAVVCGAVAAVNALLLAWHAWVVQLFRGRSAVLAGRIVLAAVLPFAAVAALLAFGYAGEPVLESWITLATGSYFLAYAALCWATTRLPSIPRTAVPGASLSLFLAGFTLYGGMAGG